MHLYPEHVIGIVAILHWQTLFHKHAHHMQLLTLHYLFASSWNCTSLTEIAILVGHTFSIFYSTEITSLIYKTGSVTDLKEEPTPQSSFPFACLKSVSDPLLVFLTFDPHCFKPTFKRLWQTTPAKRINKLSLFRTVSVCLNEWLMLFVCKAPVG